MTTPVNPVGMIGLGPVNPGPKPIIPTGSTGAAISDLRYHHTEYTKIFAEYENTDKALRQLLLACTDELYIRSLRHKYIGYGKTTNRALLDHLYATYANISASALQDNMLPTTAISRSRP